MHLLDTDIFIWILRGKEEIIQKVLDLKIKSPLGISVITIAEIYQNIFPSELLTTEEHIKQYVCFPVDEKIARIAGLYWQEYSKKLKNLTIADCLIAATANTNEAILISLNRKHFPMKNIKLLDF